MFGIRVDQPTSDIRIHRPRNADTGIPIWMKYEKKNLHFISSLSWPRQKESYISNLTTGTISAFYALIKAVDHASNESQGGKSSQLGSGRCINHPERVVIPIQNWIDRARLKKGETGHFRCDNLEDCAGDIARLQAWSILARDTRYDQALHRGLYVRACVFLVWVLPESIRRPETRSRRKPLCRLDL